MEKCVLNYHGLEESRRITSYGSWQLRRARLLVPDGIRKSTQAKDEWTNLEGVGSYVVRRKGPSKVPGNGTRLVPGI